MFKHELMEMSTRKGFEFKYVKNDSIRVAAKCSVKRCKWLILCSWCNGKKMFIVKHYVPNNSCLLRTTRNRRVTTHVVTKKFCEVISAMPFIRPRHLRAMVRKDLGVFISNNVSRNDKTLVIKKIEAQFWEDFRVLNDYVMELKETNPRSSVFVVSEWHRPSELPLFQKIYIYALQLLGKGFLLVVGDW